MTTQSESSKAKDQIKSILHAKFAKLVKNGMEPKAAFLDVMGAFERQFPGLIEKLS